MLVPSVRHDVAGLLGQFVFIRDLVDRLDVDQIAELGLPKNAQVSTRAGVILETRTVAPSGIVAVLSGESHGVLVAVRQRNEETEPTKPGDTGRAGVRTGPTI
jgi:hypothetical protein